MEAMRSLEKSCWRKKCANKFSINESLETSEEREYGEETAGHPMCAGLQGATQAKEVFEK